MSPQELACEHVRFAAAVSRRVADARAVPPRLREDMVGAGMVGLMEAAHAYRLGTRASFVAFAAHRIRGAALDELRRQDHLRLQERRHVKHGRVVDPGRPASLDALATVLVGAPEPAVTPSEPLPVPVQAALRSLPARERRILVLTVARGATLREAGAAIGLSESGACRLRTQALHRLRAALA